MSVQFRVEREEGRVVCERCAIADHPLERARGPVGRKRLEPGEGIYLATSSIHTHFMRFPIDAVFVDDELTVLRIEARLRPWRIVRHRGAEGVIELESGASERAGLHVGDRLAFVARDDAEADGEDRTIRVAVSTTDRRFSRVAAFLLTRGGFLVSSERQTRHLPDLVREGRVDVVLLDASDSLAAAARAARSLEALAPNVGLVLVVDRTGDGNGNGGGPAAATIGSIEAVPKWGSFDAVIAALERSYAQARDDHVG